VKKLLNVLLLLIWLGTLTGSAFPAQAAPPPQTDPVERLMSALTPQEKVGQLFLVTFYGPNAGSGTDIEKLILRYHIGGVAILAANDNLTQTDNLPLHLLTLTNQLQSAAIEAARTPREPTEDTPNAKGTPPFIPLFIALNHAGNGYPATELSAGLTELPSPLAVGATWDPKQAEEVGRITGAELNALGITMLLGPSLDVLDTPRPQGAGDLGPSAFGGDPYWVGQMGQAYVRGVHAGAQGQMAVVATHFPGFGGSDRDPINGEVPTVRKSLEQLRQIELVPFFSVTGYPTDTTAVSDALLSGHLRIQKFQDIRQSTRPVSLDPQALTDLLALPEFQRWRANGGLMVSDELGVQAVKRFYDASLREFNNRRVAQDAFLAGNDLLFLAEFGLNPPQDQTDKIIDTLGFFTQKYTQDPNFAAQVDQAVRRILRLKLRLANGQFVPANSLRSADGLARLGQGRDRVLAIAQSAATLITDEATARLTDPPALTDRIVFFTDERRASQCTVCAPFALLSKTALEDKVAQVFGPTGSGQVRPNNLRSFTFDDLAAYLNAPPLPLVGEGTPPPPPPLIETELAATNWVVFAMLNVSAKTPTSNVVSTFLARPDLLRGKKVVVMAFDAPYYLDTTDVSKLTAFYALYSRAPAFIDVAARLLFQTLTPIGRSPVSVQSVGYDLAQVVSPNPGQTIAITADKQTGEVGDTIQLRTSIIRDHNGHPVPDGTGVSFSIFFLQEGLTSAPVITRTMNGVAESNFTLNRAGEIEITASSDPAFLSDKLQIIVGKTFTITVVPPPPTPSHTPLPLPTPTPTVQPTPTTQPTATPTFPTANPVQWNDFLMMLFCLGIVAGVGYWLGAQPIQGARMALSGVVGALVGYNLYALHLLPFGVTWVWTWLGAGAGLFVGWYWFMRAVGER